MNPAKWSLLAGIGLALGTRAGLFGRTEVDGDLIIYGLSCDYVLKRRLSTYTVENQDGEKKRGGATTTTTSRQDAPLN